MLKTILTPVVAMCLASAATMACSADPAPAEAVNDNASDILGGVAAKGRAFDAVGAVYGDLPTGAKLFCTATLIGPDMILGTTACTPTSATTGTAFRVGPSSKAPKQSIRVKGWTTTNPGLWARSSKDGGAAPEPLSAGLAIGYLEHAVEGVAPLPTGAFSRSDIGKRFVIVGYGEQSDRPSLPPDAGDDRPPSITGERRAGTLTLRQLEGDRFWESQYQTFDQFVEHDAQIDGSPSLASDKDYRAEHEALWDLRLTDADAVLGALPRDSASAGAGDAGAPILGIVRGRVTVLGLSSNQRYLGPRPAPFNAAHLPLIAATFGLEANYFLSSRPACGMVSAYGTCNGDTIVRCTTPNEGTPRIVETECAALGMQCSDFGAVFGQVRGPRQCISSCETNADCTGYVSKAGTCANGRCTWPSFP